MKLTIQVFAFLAAIALSVPASHAQTLTGAQARKSPQAEVFLAYGFRGMRSSCGQLREDRPRRDSH